MRRGPILSILAAAFLVTACGLGGGGSTPDTRTATERDIDAHLATWQGASIQSYTFTISKPCFCPPEFSGPFVVTVTDGQTTGVTRDGVAVGPDAVKGVPLTIEQVFATLRNLDPSATATITWDPRLGYPTEATVDPIKNAVDDEYSLSITQLTPAD